MFCLSIEEPLYILQRKKVLRLSGLFCFLFPGVQELDLAFPPAFEDVDLDSNPLAQRFRYLVLKKDSGGNGGRIMNLATYGM